MFDPLHTFQYNGAISVASSHIKLIISESRLDASSLKRFKTEVGVLQLCKLLKVEL